MSKRTSSNSINPSTLDPNMAIKTERDESMKWLSPLEQPFHIAGFHWLQEERKYRRLPSTPSDTLPPDVDVLANCTAGGQIRFRTDSSRLSIRVKLGGPSNMYHMPATGQCGFDCYLGEPGDLHYLSTTRFDHTMTEYEASFYDWKEKRLHHVTLNFPLYQSVEEVWIGVDQDAAVGAAAAYVSDKPVVVYGTSITQGGCASRPGMAYPNLLSRKIPYEFINLGFSGSGKGEPEVARTIASIRNPAMFVVDYEANVPSVEHLAETLPIFIHILRERHPDAPILVVNRIASAMERLDPELHQLLIDRRNVQHTTVERFRDAGDSNVHFLDGRTMLGDDYPEECTVDGLHPTDLGFLLMSRSIEPVIRKLLQM
ncbi:SGNH/GDSL hydrolase family protein [Paenibacillus sp. 598K]|uniref:SGNH/GDSL hydrolase family protein n=1 Tax=Paenibacillus sp. 598K TaxID=1117987 RepID=UPI0021A9C0EB|nr:SGNH/GDSL hydrolase family protein [Paenibacillus sp. 598K]